MSTSERSTMNRQFNCEVEIPPLNSWNSSLVGNHWSSSLGLGQWFLTFFYISYPFIKQDYQIYAQYTQRCSFIETTKLTNFFSLEWFIKIYVGWNLWCSKITPFEKWNLSPGVNLPHINNHWYRARWRGSKRPKTTLLMTSLTKKTKPEAKKFV